METRKLRQVSNRALKKNFFCSHNYLYHILTAGSKICLKKQLETFPPARGSFIFLFTVQRNVEPIDLAVETQRLTGTNYRLTSWALCNVSPPLLEARNQTNLIQKQLIFVHFQFSNWSFSRCFQYIGSDLQYITMTVLPQSSQKVKCLAQGHIGFAPCGIWHFRLPAQNLKSV